MSKTIQLWPSGGSITFDGSYPHYSVMEGGTSREGTEGEQRAIQRNELAAGYVDHQIYCCDSSLVSDLIQEEFDGFSVDDIENVYQDTSDWTLEQCRDYIVDHSGESACPDPDPWNMTRADIIEELTSISIDCRDDESDETLIAALIANINDETISGLDDWRETAREIVDDNPQEAYEWWRVSNWLCGKLRGQGEIVIDNGYGCWWGRGCTGQSMIMDGTLQGIADSFLD